MERNQANSAPEAKPDVVIDALLAPGEGSFVDALLALADEAANGNAPDKAQRALNGGFQAALARRMREAIGHEGSSDRDAA